MGRYKHSKFYPPHHITMVKVGPSIYFPLQHSKRLLKVIEIGVETVGARVVLIIAAKKDMGGS